MTILTKPHVRTGVDIVTVTLLLQVVGSEAIGNSLGAILLQSGKRILEPCRFALNLEPGAEFQEKHCAHRI